ncbi:MAG: BON domain-containing protein [bacterium]|nr:BON domain-containing protein [bacterium]
MIKLSRIAIMLIFCGGLLSGCLSNMFTGANLVYDRHNVYKKLNDYQLFAAVNNVLSVDKIFRNDQCVLDIAVFNGDILLAGHVPNQAMRDEITRRMRQIHGYRHLFTEVVVSRGPAIGVQDSWITTKIRSQIFADDAIDPNSFKIITSDRIVYIMGDVQPNQAEKVINIARFTNGVIRVVKLLNYFTYQPKKNMA